MSAIFLAFSIGFFGSLHCLGMCGPLALGIHGLVNPDNRIRHVLIYNGGRIISYAFLGLIFGLLGEFVVMYQMQKWVTIGLGIFLILLFFFSVSIEHVLLKMNWYARLYNKVSKRLGQIIQRYGVKSTFFTGMFNGILPCGLVYLALLGSFSMGNLLSGSVFMVAFGLGTAPAMIGIVLGYSFLPKSFQSKLRRVLVYMQLVVGVILLMRGINIGLPLEMDFISAMKNPILCH